MNRIVKDKYSRMKCFHKMDITYMELKLNYFFFTLITMNLCMWLNNYSYTCILINCYQLFSICFANNDISNKLAVIKISRLW